MSTQIDKIAEWLDWLRIDAAASTVAGYAWELRALEKFFPDRSVLELTKADLARYLSHRRVMQHCGDATIRRSVNAFKSFYTYTLGRKSPAGKLPVPKTKKKKQRTLTWSQVETVMLACDTSTIRGKRDLAMICLVLDSGLREAEICRLTLSDVNMIDRCLTVQVKGGDDGDGVFGVDTWAALSSWLAVRPLCARGVDNFFVSIGGGTAGQKITPSGLRVIFRRIAKAADLRDQSGKPQRFSPHDLRRSFATLSSKLKAPTRLIQVGGRWSDIRQVENYTRALEATDFAEYSPVSYALKLKHGD